MNAKYWTAKYIDDVFRNEPKNVGVIVSVGADVAARFWGERDDGILDGRKLVGKFAYPSVYTQWVDYWRDEIEKGGIAEIVAAKTSNFFVSEAGQVSDIGADTAADVCQFLFTALVSGGVAEAFNLTDENAVDQDLSVEILDVLRQTNLLDEAELLVRHPIRRNDTVTGRRIVHKPSFSQKNGLLSVFEYIDLSRPQQKHIKERSGWMASMFSDIKEFDSTASTFSLVKPEPSAATQTEGTGRRLSFSRMSREGLVHMKCGFR